MGNIIKNNRNTIPVVFASDENYVKPLSAAVTSMLKNAFETTWYDIYILVPEQFSSRSKYLILSLEDEFSNCCIKFIPVLDKFNDSYIRIPHITTVTYYRLLIPTILSNINKCIYLDVDIIVNGDLFELFSTDIEDFYIAGVKGAGYHYPEEWAIRHSKELSLPNMKQYINAGVLVMNLFNMRNNNLQDLFLELEKKNFHSQDQDIINVACYNKIKHIELKYNFMTTRFSGTVYHFEYDEIMSLVFEEKEILEAVKKPIIVHYANKIKPWDSLSTFNSDLWWKYFNLSPFNFNDINSPVNITLNPKVSVIIPIYNVQDYLTDCLDSLIKQTLKDIEIICVDDGSTDNSFWILKKYAAIDKRIIILQQENAGAGVARNKGLSLAKGTFLSFLDADDFFEHNMLERAVNCIEENESEIVIFKSDKYIERTGKFEPSNWTIRFNMIPKKLHFSSKELFEHNKNTKISINNEIENLNQLNHQTYDIFQSVAGFAWDKIFRREFVQKYNIEFSRTAIYNDLFFVYMSFLLANRITIENNVLIHQRKRILGSSLSDRRSDSYSSVDIVLSEFRQSLIDKNLYKKYEQDFINYALHLLLHTLDTVKGVSYTYVYNLIRTEWANKYKINEFNSEYFFNKKEYAKYVYIRNTELIIHLMERLEISESSSKNIQKYTKQSSVNNKEFNKIKGQLRWSREELNKIRAERLDLKKELIQIRGIKLSSSYRIGRFITWLPRKFIFLNKNNANIKLNKNNTTMQNYKFFEKLEICDYKKALKIWYKNKTRENLNLLNPKPFNQKIQWLKLYDSTPLKTRLSDKYLVREWIKEKIGEKYLIPLLGVWDSFDDIDFDELPNQFALKTNHGSGWNYIVDDKSRFDKLDAKKKFDKWMSMNYAFYGLQLQYFNINPKIIAEQYIQNSNQLYDYRFFCYNGVVDSIWVDVGSGTDSQMRNIFDLNWNLIDINISYPSIPYNINKPNNFNKMIDFSEKLSKNFAFVRIDFYEVKSKLYFGEMTFTPNSGLAELNDMLNKNYGNMIKLPKKTKFTKFM